MKVHNELLIAHRERLENHVSSQVILDLATKLGQGLNVTHHLDQMMNYQATLYQQGGPQGTVLKEYTQFSLA
jgi:hypothetical protein